MSTLVRWWRFNCVGAIGMAVQLGALACFARLIRGYYLLATAAAVELTLLHNFVWHLHYTWRDRRSSSAIAGQLLRFHLANGLVSLVGNLALMRILVTAAHLPVLAANGIAILVCSAANYLLSDRWAFVARVAGNAETSCAGRCGAPIPLHSQTGPGPLPGTPNP
jgi:putative flippase GtrA